MSEKTESEVVTTTPWQCKLSTPEERLASLYQTSKFTDLTITFPGHEETMKAHRLILAMSSPVFEVMLFCPLAEKENLSLPDDPPESFSLLLKYLYCGSTEFSSIKLAVQVYCLANKYQMDALTKVCSEFLQRELNPDNFPEVYDTAVLHEDVDLLNKCIMIVRLSASAAFSSPHFGQLSRTALRQILQQDFYIINESNVYKAIVSWGAAQRNGSKGGDESLRHVIEEFLPEVRFLTMTVDEVLEHIVPTNILTPDETISVLMSIKNMQNITLPTGFSNNKEKRYSADEKLTSIRMQLGDYPYYGYNDHITFSPGEWSFAQNITFSDTVYLKKIICHGRIFQNCSTLTIKNNFGHVVSTTRVSENEAVFATPVCLTKGTKFNFCSNYTCSYNMNVVNSTFTNGNVTLQGTFVQYLGDLTIYYWYDK